MDWRDTTVAPDGTHHRDLAGRPLYARRFLEVLKYHAPGLAPVRDDSGAYHVDLDGRPAYPQRHLRTFGFYQELAAVDTGEGWCHVRTDGSSVYAERHAWCGNFQGGRVPVRTVDGQYHHLDREGRLRSGPWAYAGDYRDGIAVVQRSDGLHSHVDQDGRLVHGHWFVDLDVFHKGFARARDRAGWFHVDRDGVGVYGRRFAMVEPFYNGQARVELESGALEVVDEQGRTVQVLRGPRRSELAVLSGDMVGFWRTDAIAAAVRLGLVQALPGTAGELATACGLDVLRLDALLRGLWELGLVEPSAGRWSLTSRGRLLHPDHPLTMADAALEYAGPLRRRWDALPLILAESTFEPQDVFTEVAADPARVAPHHRMLRSYARHDYAQLPEALGLQGTEHVLDVGGGVGVLGRLLVQRHPEISVTVLDRPEVLALIDLQPEERERIHLLAADLFAPWGITADCAVLARVLHDWDDQRAVAILERVREVLRAGSVVYVVELLLGVDSPEGGLCDLHLLAATGGRERTSRAYARLLDAAGFDLVEERSLPAVPSVLVARAR